MISDISSPDQNPTRPFWRKGAFLFFFACCIHFAGVWILPLTDRDEPRFAEATREMRERQDWIVPHFNNQYRFDKPPLTYWAQALSCRVFGESDWSVRLPSVLASALTSLLVFLWGRRAAGEKVGFWAALIFSTALQVFVRSKYALADPYLFLFFTVAAWAGWEIVAGGQAGNNRHSTVWKCLFVAGLALGFLAKGPIAWIPLGMLAATRLRRVKGGPGWLQICLLLLATLALVMLWALPAQISSGGEYFRVGVGRHVVARGLTPFEGHGGRAWMYFLWLPFYFVTVFFSFFPWSIQLPWLVKRLWFQTSRDEFTLYLISGVGLVVGIFTFYTSRDLHYILPAFPMLALLLAREWFQAGRPSTFLRRCSVGMTIGSLAVAFLALPLLRRDNPTLQLFRLSEPWLKPEMEFAAVDYHEPSMVWYFRSKVRGYFTELGPEAVADFMAKPGPRFCVVPVDAAEKLFPVIPEKWQVVGDVSGWNLVKGKRVHLRLIVKPE